jgi:hypothetical protein
VENRFGSLPFKRNLQRYSVGPGQAQQLVECPKEMVGRVIGRGGETIKGLQSQTAGRCTSCLGFRV